MARVTATQETVVIARLLSIGVAASLLAGAMGTVAEPNPTANFTAHWNGTAWSVVPAPCLEGTAVTACSGNSINLNELTGVTALSSNDAFFFFKQKTANDMNFHIPYM